MGSRDRDKEREMAAKFNIKNKKNTNHKAHIMGNGIDTYKTIWEDRNTGLWFFVFNGVAIGAAELRKNGYEWVIG